MLPGEAPRHCEDSEARCAMLADDDTTRISEARVCEMHVVQSPVFLGAKGLSKGPEAREDLGDLRCPQTVRPCCLRALESLGVLQRPSEALDRPRESRPPSATRP